MSYEPYTWRGGDTVTASKLNHIEQGISDAGQSGGSFFVNIDMENMVLDKTAGEIYTAMQNGQPTYIYAIDSEDSGVMHVPVLNIGGGVIRTLAGMGSSSFEVIPFFYESLDDYPSMQPPIDDGSGDGGTTQK